MYLVVFHKQTKTKKDKAAVDAVFFKRLGRILKILLPGWFTPEVPQIHPN